MNFITSFVDHGYRFRALSYDKENKFNLLFLPGGPGLGSEAYLPWLAQKNIQDTNIWLLDFPGDGSIGYQMFRMKIGNRYNSCYSFTIKCNFSCTFFCWNVCAYQDLKTLLG